MCDASNKESRDLATGSCAAILVVTVLLAACSTIDPSQPISLVTDGEWGTSQIQDVADAAECWNLEFGTQFEMRGGGAARQLVVLSFNDLVCFTAAGRTDTPPPGSIYICPRARTDRSLADVELFHTVLHELGHVLNILGHAEQADSVMSASSSSIPEYFSDEDHKLFAAANPDFTPRPRCGRTVISMPCACESNLPRP